MSKLKEKNLDLSASKIVKIAMKVGRLPITSSSVEWINPTTKIKTKGIVLTMKDIEHGGAGFAELDLNKREDLEIFEAFMEWYNEGSDPRIKQHGVTLLPPDSVAKPMPWWNTKTHWKKLLAQVEQGIRDMDTVVEREAFVEQCVRYESQQENPRKGLIDALLGLELDGVSSADPLAVPDED